MKKNSMLLLVIAALALAGCKDKSKTEILPSPGMKTLEIPAGSGKKSTVTKTMNGGGYTYVEVSDDKGEKVWLGLPETKVAEGDKVEYRDVPPTLNFNSKILNKKFDKILFVPGVRIDPAK